MASSKLWRVAALAHQDVLSISSVHAGQLIARASHMGSWSSLTTLYICTTCMELGASHAACGMRREQLRRNVEAAFSSRCGFTNIFSLDLGSFSELSASLTKSVLRALPNLTALCAAGCSLVDISISLAGLPSLCERLQKLSIGGMCDQIARMGDQSSARAREEEAMRSLGRLRRLETLVLSRPYPDRSHIPSGLRSLRRLHIEDNLEMGPADGVVSDEFLASAFAVLPLLETFSCECMEISGTSLRSTSLTALSLHSCSGLTADGLHAMVGALPALRKLAFTSIFDEANDPYYEVHDLIDFIASCHELAEVSWGGHRGQFISQGRALRLKLVVRVLRK